MFLVIGIMYTMEVMGNCIAGPIEYANCEDLEAGLGERLRSVYANVGERALPRILALARKAVHVSYRTCRSWLQKYGPGAAKKRTAPTVLKRPASRVLKRPAAENSAGASSSSSAASALVNIAGTKALEETIGDRYRKEVSDYGLGLGFSL